MAWEEKVMKKQWLISAGILAMSASLAYGATPSFQGLGFVEAWHSESRAYGLSADGSAVVGQSGDQAFRWTQDAGIEGLSDLPGGGFSSKAYAVSTDGSVVVGVGRSETHYYEAFVWSSGGGMQGLGSFGTPTGWSWARGVSADGSVIVGSGHNAFGDKEAFIWTPGGGMQGLDPGGLYNWSDCWAVSADGTVATGTCCPAHLEAFRWTQQGGLQQLGDLEGGSLESHAEGISADGTVIVGYGVSESGREAFRWTGGCGMEGLGDLPGGNFYSAAYDCSADGAVVVGYGVISTVGHHAFYWTETASMRRLQEVLTDDCGLDLTGWTLETASSVSDDGLTIVGWGLNPDGNREAWLATIPEPATLGLVAAGLVAVWMRKRRVTG